MNMTERILTKREAAAELNVSIRTLERYISAGLIPAGKTLGGHVRIAESVVAAAKQTPVAVPPAPEPDLAFVDLPFKPTPSPVDSPQGPGEGASSSSGGES